MDLTFPIYTVFCSVTQCISRLIRKQPKNKSTMALFDSVEVQVVPPELKEEDPCKFISVVKGHFFEKGSCEY